jgi:hypothetical protein
MVSKEGWKNLSAEEKEEIEQAADEYEALREEAGGDIYEAQKYAPTDLDSNNPFISNLYIIGNFIERNVNDGRLKPNNKHFAVSFLIVRAYRLIRALYRMEKYSTAEERFILLRALYEVYCKIVYCLSAEDNAEHLFAIDFGLTIGSHELLTIKGITKRSKVIDKESGKIYDRYVKFRDLISFSKRKTDLPLFDSLYEFLSSFVHSGSRHVRSMLNADLSAFELTQEDESVAVFVSVIPTLSQR